jgi:two-component system sensor histidine kinase PilS (NtrC family)
VNAAVPARSRPKSRRLTTQDDWRILRALSSYRFLLAVLLLILFEAGYAPRFFEQVQGPLFQIGCLVYLAVSLMLLVPLSLRWPGITVQTHLQFVADVLCVGTLIWSSSGVSSGLGMLLVTPTVGCSLILPARLALLLAAGAAMALIGEELAQVYYLQAGNGAFTETGILGSVFLITALATNAVAERARRSEAIAVRVGSDLANLTRLNERIVEQMQAGAVVVDESHRIRLINAAARRMLTLPPNTGAGQRLDAVAPRLAVAFVNWSHGHPHSGEPIAPAPNTEEVMVRFSSLGADPAAPTLILLDDAREAQARAQQLKLVALGRLSASIAHEIRNPLAAISNAGQLLAESGERKAEDKRLLGMIQRHSERINRIVNDILTLSRRDSRGPEVLEIPAWLQRAVAQYREGSPTSAREIRIEQAAAPFEVLFDPDHLQQVLINLWDNAFQHGGEQVAVTIRCQRSGPTRQPCLEIEDNGRGIPAEMVEQVFEPFFTTAHQGTGLGLYLARELCEYNQARLSYAPRREGGACFRLVMMEIRQTR